MCSSSPPTQFHANEDSRDFGSSRFNARHRHHRQGLAIVWFSVSDLQYSLPSPGFKKIVAVSNIKMLVLQAIKLFRMNCKRLGCAKGVKPSLLN
ncbi:hypothetical protein L1887_03032 [Cichorium endivia]|nr:hypothetical protein L1887_03032 [Cichorium endivia]